MANLRLCLLLIIGCFFYSGNVLHAQKAKFKNSRVSVQKTRLPINYIEPENRTYDLYAKGAYSTNINAHDKGIYGWKLTQDNPSLEAAVSVYGFTIPSPTRTSQKKEKKNKEGKVTDRWTEYTYHGKAIGKGTLYMYGASNPFVYEKKNAKKSKAELKKEAEAKAKEKELSENSFLSAEDVEEAESDISEDTGLEGTELGLIKTVKLDIEKNVSTKAYRSSSAAYRDYTGNQKPKLYEFKSNYPSSAYSKAVRTLNYNYGYSPLKYTFNMRRMKSEKHDQFKKWNDACTATATLFKTFRYNKSIEGKQAKFDAILAYFSGIVEKIPDNDRKAKRMKKAAFYNLVNMLYYLDRHEAVISLCKKYESSKLLDGMCKKYLGNSDRQIALMAFHKVKSCHIEVAVEEEIDESDIESEEDDDTGEGK